MDDIKVNAINKYHLDNNYEAVKKELIPFIKKYKTLPEKRKTFVISTLININAFTQALQLVEKEIALDQLLEANEELLIRQAYLGSMKIYFDSIEVGKRILFNIVEVLKVRTDISQKSLKNIVNSITSWLKIIECYDKIYEVSLIYKFNHTLDVYDYFIISEFEFAKIHHNKKFDLAIFDKLAEQAKGISEFEFLEYYLFAKKLQIALEAKLLDQSLFDRAQTLLDENKVPMMYLAFHYRCLARFQFLKKDFELALTYFKKSQALGGSNQWKVINYFWMEQIDPASTTYEQKLFIRCAPFRSVTSYLIGNRLYDDYSLLPIHEHFIDLKKAEKQEEDCWFIDNTSGTIQSIEYKKFENNSQSVLDLHSGIITKNGLTKYILTEKRAKALSVLIAYGNEGAPITFLIDAIFDEKFYFYHSAHLRIQNLINEIKKLGFKINQKDNLFFYNFDKNQYDIIFSKNQKCIGTLPFLAKKFNGEINNKNVIEGLNVKPATAALFIKEWKALNLIGKDPKKKYGNYIVL